MTTSGNALEIFFRELREAREANHMTVADIADATLINITFLEALERGDTTMLPATYIRAFIREYAATVGLDPMDVMRRYDTARNPQESRPLPPPHPGPPPPPAHEALPPSRPARDVFLTSRAARIALIVVLAAAGAIALWNLLDRNPSKNMKETPFSSVVREYEPADTTAHKPPAPRPSVDSLVLTGVTSDSVWMQVVIDGRDTREYLFGPNARMTWKSATGYAITLGNAGAVQFTLNKKTLGTLGKRGNVVRDVRVTRQQLTAK
jgi:transcriptional regulator with XRE-family HTH domain